MQAAVERRLKDDVERIENTLVEELKAAGLSQRRALSVSGISRGSWHYRVHGRPGSGVSVSHTERRWVAWLDPEEQDAIKVKLAAREPGVSVSQAFYDAFDAGEPVASLSTWHRLERTRRDSPPRPKTRRKPPRMPVLEATAPMQVWTWDITELPGPYRGTTFHLYIVLDLFSRMIVAARIEDREDQDLAAAMFTHACAQYGATPRFVHSDGGSSMMSEAVAAVFTDLGITRSRSRPGVSNDNPFSEAVHKTVKYWRGAPVVFDSIDHARAWFTGVKNAYNTTHHHSGLAGYTPASVHDGTWTTVRDARQAALDQLHQANPARYHRPPVAKIPATTVGINTKKPKQ